MGLQMKAFLRHHCRRSSPLLHILGLSSLTFLVIFPLLCHRLLYSYYFFKFLYLKSMSHEALQASLARGQTALHYWQSFNGTPQLLPVEPVSPQLLVTIVTAARPTEGVQYHYVLQVAELLDRALMECGGCAEVLLCNVEEEPEKNEDVALLKKRFPMVERFKDLEGQASTAWNTFEKEKQDYVYCLKRSLETFNPQNVLLLEDDAAPLQDFFPVVQNLISRSFYSNTLYVKLFHPERLHRYWNPEPYRILEWIGLGMSGASVLCALYKRLIGFSPKMLPFLFLFFMLYTMAAAELFGRHYLLELRRLSPQLYAVSPATECCTPAMLFPHFSARRVMHYLNELTCKPGFAKDIALYDSLQKNQSERAHSVEPNLVQHIGAFSSVRFTHSEPRLL
ncbi:transmembrane protein 246 [Polypterus senegalus]|uniref:transmembrane protein 246 n=1 Tax=Polypterus senegalus TaxID=55291 RepID=UPI0019637E41|nr:transmembrane protein 246 [Polypterus senegalus]XP_039623434.1 transmembrane protein 246 [Polypterus senegalus]XP_039623435.1 transmembrane protein 246 [Polypterus senegalus]